MSEGQNAIINVIPNIYPVMFTICPSKHDIISKGSVVSIRDVRFRLMLWHIYNNAVSKNQ